MKHKLTSTTQSNLTNKNRFRFKKLMNYLSILCCLFWVTCFSQTKNVLFLGNSYTYYHSLPQLTSDIALSFGDTIFWDSNTPGGYTFNQHSTNTTSLTKISAGNWDHVILQEQSQLPSFPPFQVASDCFPYASLLVDSILSANPCTEPIFFMTWGRENGDQGNCANYPPLCTYDGMQARLRESYIQMSIDNECTVSPVGAAWKYIRDNHPSINLYTADGSHPSIYGSYLAACVHYSTIFRKSPLGSTFNSSLSQTDAHTLQQAAKLVVIDSLDNWRIGANDAVAGFNYTINGSLASFSLNSTNIDSVLWKFGDLSTSNSLNPNHEYLDNGNYLVELIAFLNCTSDTSYQTISISGLSIKEHKPFTLNYTNDCITINFKSSAEKSISVINSIGKLIYFKETNERQLILPKLESQFHILTVWDQNYGRSSLKIIQP
ncbi:MAG: hypothetical protein CL853_08430 [Crocinitomicaceae bacterium]|nr:hypothetical protein [Crocinitomicaceae bacterium]